MVSLGALWIPIVVASVLAFLSGVVLYMLIPLHRDDWAMLPDEAGIMDRLRQVALKPGNYNFPCAVSPKEMGNPEFIAKMEKGPVGIAIVRPSGQTNMGPSLIKMMLFHVIVSVLIAYLASRTLPVGADYLKVFQVVGTAGILAYSGGGIPFAIWYRPTGRFTLNQVIDGIVWGLLTAGAFGWLWPR